MLSGRGNCVPHTFESVRYGGDIVLGTVMVEWARRISPQSSGLVTLDLDCSMERLSRWVDGNICGKPRILRHIPIATGQWRTRVDSICDMLNDPFARYMARCQYIRIFEFVWVHISSMPHMSGLTDALPGT